MTTAAPLRSRTEVVPFTAGDGMPLNLHHVVGERPPTRGPVLLVHGAGVRADIFRAPDGSTSSATSPLTTAPRPRDDTPSRRPSSSRAR